MQTAKQLELLAFLHYRWLHCQALVVLSS